MSGRRATVSAPANIALIKYWGARDPERAIPLNPSLSMTLEVCRSLTTVEAVPGGDGAEDRVWIVREGQRADPGEPFTRRVRGHLDALRQRLGRNERFRVATRNTFPAAAGLASSASGFAALACAAARALDLDPSPAELSVLARLSGSGSAARSVLGGYVQWPGSGEPGHGGLAGAEPRSGQASGQASEPDDRAPAEQIAAADHWDLRDVIALVESGPKEVPSLEGHRRAPTSPHFARRLELLPSRLAAVRRALHDRDLDALGVVLETDAVELHVIAMTSDPPIFYWRPGTLEVLEAVRALRSAGTGAWATMDAGANVHVLCEAGDEAEVAQRLETVPSVGAILRDRVGRGPRLEEADLLELPAGGEASGEAP